MNSEKSYKTAFSQSVIKSWHNRVITYLTYHLVHGPACQDHNLLNISSCSWTSMPRSQLTQHIILFMDQHAKITTYPTYHLVHGPAC